MWKYLLLIWCRCLVEVEAARQHYVHWNISNSLFFNTNIIDITSSATKSDQAQASDYEQANIICPLYERRVPRTLTEQYVVYNVTKHEYDRCQLSSNDAKIVALCNTPYKPQFFTLTFRSFSPTPGAFEFHPGQKYYFIATNYLDQQSNQRSSEAVMSRPKCSHPPMRLIFRIKDDKLGPDSRDGHINQQSQHVTAAAAAEDTIGRPREMPMQTKISSNSGISSAASSTSSVKHLSNLSRTTLLVQLITIFTALLLCQ